MTLFHMHFVLVRALRPHITSLRGVHAADTTAGSGQWLPTGSRGGKEVQRGAVATRGTKTV